MRAPCLFDREPSIEAVAANIPLYRRSHAALASIDLRQTDRNREEHRLLII